MCKVYFQRLWIWLSDVIVRHTEQESAELFADIYASINEHIQALGNNVKHKAGKGNVLTFVKVIEQNNSEFY